MAWRVKYATRSIGDKARLTSDFAFSDDHDSLKACIAWVHDEERKLSSQGYEFRFALIISPRNKEYTLFNNGRWFDLKNQISWWRRWLKWYK